MTTIDDALSFCATHHRGVLATYRRDGAAQLSPIVAVPLGAKVVISSRERAIKVRNLRRNPRATLLVLDDVFFGPWVLIEGEARILSLPEAMEPLVAYYRAAVGEHPDWDEYRQAMRAEERVLIEIEPTRAGPTIAG
jgi:PPOX class probable F420-dependent enzyme